jgi:transaldolase
MFVSRWDAAADRALPTDLHGRLAIATCQQTFDAHVGVVGSPRWRSLADAGATPQKVLWASTSTKNPALPDTYYVARLVGHGTVDTIPEQTLLAFADHGEIVSTLDEPIDSTGAVIDNVTRAGIDLHELADRLQRDGASAFSSAWQALLADVASKVERLSALTATKEV